jgi:hypothetical protein
MSAILGGLSPQNIGIKTKYGHLYDIYIYDIYDIYTMYKCNCKIKIPPSGISHFNHQRKKKGHLIGIIMENGIWWILGYLNHNMKIININIMNILWISYIILENDYIFLRYIWILSICLVPVLKIEATQYWETYRKWCEHDVRCEKAKNVFQL